MRKIAILGAGIVGASTAYFLSQEKDIQIEVFDDGIGQATKAAAGIISPWFSKRRNKAWYRLARLGADFYPELIHDLKQKGVVTDFYEQTGVYVLKKKKEKLEELYQLALQRRIESPIIAELKILEKKEVAKTIPDLQGFEQLLYAAGGARVDGALLTQTLLDAGKIYPLSKKVTLSEDKGTYVVDGRRFDGVVLATGAWLGEILTPLGYQVDVRPQKGQLRDYRLSLSTDAYPVIMPEGELDIIPFTGGKVSIGASHENDQGFDLQIDQSCLDRLEVEATSYLPSLQYAKKTGERVGTRAYTSDFSPFWGEVPELKHVYAASGLGSSGLTTGPLIGHQLAQMILDKPLRLSPSDYPIEHYVTKVIKKDNTDE